jgi:hypothetical protein
VGEVREVGEVGVARAARAKRGAREVREVRDGGDAREAGDACDAPGLARDVARGVLGVRMLRAAAQATAAEVGDDFARRIVTGRACYSAAGMRAGATHI